MKHTTIARWLPWLLIAVGPALLGRCGGATEQGTENIVVPGSPRDEDELTASAGSASQAVQGSTPTSGDLAGADGGAPPGACTTLRETLAARVSAGFASVDKTCQRDEDCFYFSTDSGCYSSCESMIGSRSGARAAGTAVVQDIASLCNEFDDQRCETPLLTCLGGEPVLVCNATCTNIAALSCDDLSSRAAARVTTLVNDASRTCSRDDDCTLAQTDIRCVPSCGNFQSVASSALQGLQNSITETERLYCGSAESSGCPGPIELPCVPPLGTRQTTCNAGQCEITYVPQP